MKINPINAYSIEYDTFVDPLYTLDTASITLTAGKLTAAGIDVIHTAAENDDHAIEIDANAAGFGDVKALDINYITGAISAGEDEAIILINIDEIAAGAGSDIFGLEILATDGSAEIFGLKAGVLVGPIHQDSGTFANPAIGTNDTPTTGVPEMIDGDSGPTKRTSIFLAVDDYIIIGATTAFEEIEFILTTGSSGAGIKPKFEYSTGGSGFTEFSPVDGTNGFRNTGVVAWDADDLTGHAVNADTGAANTYDIRITRERNSLSTTPILGYAKTAATTEYLWDKDGDVNIRNLTISGTIASAAHTITATGVGLDIDGEAGNAMFLLRGQNDAEAFIFQTTVDRTRLFYQDDHEFVLLTSPVASLLAGTPGVDDIRRWAIDNSGNVTMAGALTGVSNISIGANLIHTGDANTFLSFSTDQIDLLAGGSTILTVDYSGAARLGFFNIGPQVQQAHIIDADGNLADITTKFNTLLADLEGYGLLAAA